MIAEADVRHWQEWTGRSEMRSERLDIAAARRFAAATGQDLDVAAHAPALAHWAFFLPVATVDEVGEDGHPKRGGFLPPVTLPRRMFAAAEMEFVAPLDLDQAAELTSTVVSVTHKSGQSGELVFVEVARVLAQQGGARVREKQTIVYRGAGAPIAPLAPAAAAPQGEAWTPATTDLFRFSAATFNTHRIHYDLPYARDVEGYPDLVVQGPLLATKLCALARRTAGRPLTRFSFRAQAPVFVSQPVAFVADRSSQEVKVVRCDGAAAMTATYS
ncbi:MAG: hypothetical protein AB7O98_07575 [Hyphomonadaceae bacterium]